MYTYYTARQWGSQIFVCKNGAPLSGMCQETTLFKLSGLLLLVGILVPISCTERARTSKSVAGKNVMRSKYFFELKRGQINCLT